MPTRSMEGWTTSIARIVNEGEREDTLIRGHSLNDLIGSSTFAETMFLLLNGRMPTTAQGQVLDALLVACMEHGIAPPSMISRCFASYGTTIQQAIGAGITAFGDRMGGLGEQMAKMMVDRLDGITETDDATLTRIAEETVRDVLDAGDRVPGFGIPLHNRDPRADRVLEVAREKGTYGVYCRFAEALGAALAKARGGNEIGMNIDGVSACVPLDLGFDWRTTRMFLLIARSVSMGAHFLEEQDQDSTWRHIPADQITYDMP